MFSWEVKQWYKNKISWLESEGFCQRVRYRKRYFNDLNIPKKTQLSVFWRPYIELKVESDRKVALEINLYHAKISLLVLTQNINKPHAPLCGHFHPLVYKTVSRQPIIVLLLVYFNHWNTGRYSTGRYSTGRYTLPFNFDQRYIR
jgi:hypothetical protein